MEDHIHVQSKESHASNLDNLIPTPSLSPINPDGIHDTASLKVAPGSREASLSRFVQVNTEEFSSSSSPSRRNGKEPIVDYFSLPVHRSSSGISAEEFVPPFPDFMESPDLADETATYIFVYPSASHLPLNVVTHPTGGPLLHRDIIPPPRKFKSLNLDPAPTLRGGSYENEDYWSDEGDALMPEYPESPSSIEVEVGANDGTAGVVNTQPTWNSTLSAARSTAPHGMSQDANDYFSYSMMAFLATDSDHETMTQEHHHVDSSATNKLSNADDVDVDVTGENLGLQTFSPPKVNGNQSIYSPRSSSLESRGTNFPSDDSDQDPRDLVDVYLTKMPVQKALRPQTPYLTHKGSEKKMYKDDHMENPNELDTSRGIAIRDLEYNTSAPQGIPPCGTDTPAPFSEVAEIDKVTQLPIEFPSLGEDGPRPSSPPITFRPESKRLMCRSLDPVDTTSYTLFKIASTMTRGERASLNSGPPVNIIDSSTGEIYLHRIPQRMLFHFCGERFVFKRLKVNTDVEGTDVFRIAPEEAEKSAVVRVLRYLRRWCCSLSAAPTGEIRVPPDLRVGIETIRVCKLFGFHADAKRIEELLVDTYMIGEHWNMTDEHVEIIWGDYDGSFRETPFGDAIVWFILTEVQSGEHPLADEIKWIMEQEEYESLKTRVKEENMSGKWRNESRRRFLINCAIDRQETQRRERKNNEIIGEINERVKKTRMERLNRLERVSKEAVPTATRVSRQEAPAPDSRPHHEQRPDRRATRNVESAQGSARLEERDHPVRRVPSTETQLSDLWDEQPNHRTSNNATYKGFSTIPREGNEKNVNEETKTARSSGEVINQPQLVSLRTHRPDIPRPHDHRVVGRSERASSAKAPASAQATPRTKADSIPDRQLTHGKSGGFWNKLLAHSG